MRLIDTITFYKLKCRPATRIKTIQNNIFINICICSDLWFRKMQILHFTAHP